MATFTGGFFSNDRIDAVSGLIDGFTGGGIAELQDSTGDFFDGFGGNDAISAGSGDDTISGGAGDDTLTGGAGDDTIDGGGGRDTALYSLSPAAVVIHLDTQVKYASGPAGSIGTDILIDVESAAGSQSGDYFFGSAQANSFSGLGGNDWVAAGEGDDTIQGADGLDYIEASYGQDSIDGGADADTVYGGADSDTLNGGTGGDFLYGEHGADSLNGGDGDDVLFIDAADMASGAVNGGAGRDYIVWQDAENGAELNFLNNLGAMNAELFYGFTGNDFAFAGAQTVRAELYGGGGQDTLEGGNAAGSILLGEDGDDQLIGGIGIDHMAGGPGEDQFRIFINSGTDYVYDFKEGGADKVYFEATPATSFAELIVITDYAGDGWYGYDHGSGIVWLKPVGGVQPAEADFIFSLT